MLTSLKILFVIIRHKFYKLNIRLQNNLFELHNPLDILVMFKKNYPKDKVFRFIQVGANDGISHDNLFNFVTSREAAGLVIEPLKDYFQKLNDNYRNFPNIIKINKAIHPELKTVTLYRVDPSKEKDLGAFAGGIGSLLPDHHLRSNISKEYIIKENCEAVHLMELLKETGFDKNIDYLQIDTEGFDLEIIKQIDFIVFKPSIIKYEHTSLNNEDYHLALKILKDNGYTTFKDICDIIALDMEKTKV